MTRHVLGNVLKRDKLIVDNNELHPAEEKFGAVALKAGFHPISLVYFQNAGASALKISYEGEKLKKRPIPSSVLFH